MTKTTTSRTTTTRPERAARLLSAALAALLLLPSVLAGQAEDTAAEEVELNRIILRVNDEILTLHEYEESKSEQIARLFSQEGLAPARRQEMLERLPKQIVKNAFEQMLLESRARQTGVFIDDARVEQAIGELRQRQGIGSEEELRQALEAAGMSYEQLEENLRRELMLQAVMGREVHSQIEVGDEEMRARYRNNADQYRMPERRLLREVIVLDDAGLPEERRRKVADALAAGFRAGGDVEVVISSYRDQGITTGLVELGWLERAELEPSLADAAFAIEEPGGVAVVEARGGLHVVQAVEIEEAQLRPFSEVEPRIEAEMRAERFEKELRTYMAKLRDQAFVMEDLPAEAVGYEALVTFEREDELEVFQQPLEDQASEELEGDLEDGDDG